MSSHPQAAPLIQKMRKSSLRIAKARSIFRLKSKLARNCLSEFLGTAMLLFLGLSVSMQFILSNGVISSWFHVNFGWGLALTFSALATYQTSGGHLNPAISLLMVTLEKLPHSHLLPFIIAQLSGAIVGSIGPYYLYQDQFKHFTSLKTLAFPGLAACFTSFPELHVSNGTAFFDQIAGTGVLAFCICLCIDRRNKVPVFLQPLFFGLVLTMIGCSLSLNVGYPLNPARDLGPRLFAAYLYGIEVFSYHDWYFWIPLVAPCIGAIVGGWAYQIFIGIQIDDDHEEYELKVSN
ncbi:unnamed protein product, partial [Mesorhabditis belari]|uniref:Aquaporin n=1 Tax=Mesorhabditis belari TaxID=2138241 RepID=A0AAF3J4P2_9BILA